MSVHVQGMGVLGALTALRLAVAGIGFTWDDIDAPISAWPASTGLVYPAGDDWSTRNLARWREWATAEWFPTATAEAVTFCYGQKRPPHDATYRTYRVGALTAADAAAYVIHPQRLVEIARARFAARRRATAPAGARLIVAHGFRDATTVMWGWSVPVRLLLAPELAALQRRPALYGRVIHRSTYAYPIPGQPDWWWAGSSAVRQRTPTRLDGEKHLRRWRADLPAVFHDAAQVCAVAGPVRQGWRPRAATETAQPLPRLDPDTGAIVYPALRHSGVRWAPLAVDHALALL